MSEQPINDHETPVIPALIALKREMALGETPDEQLAEMKLGLAKLLPGIGDGSVARQTVVDDVCGHADVIGLSDAIGRDAVEKAIGEALDVQPLINGWQADPAPWGGLPPTNGSAELAPPTAPSGDEADRTNGGDGPVLETALASTYKMRAIRWLWPGRFAIGKLGLIGGLPDKGKGLVCSDVIACVTRPRSFPCNEGKPTQGSVIWLTAEDDIEDTVIPRLRAAGANLDRVHIVKMVRDGNKRRMFNLVSDLHALKKKIEDIGGVVLIIIDPMSAYMGVGKVNASMTSDVRALLAPLTDLATEKRVAIIGVMHFNKKADVTNAMLRIADSLAYVAASRHVYVVIDDTEIEGRRIFVKAKNNLSPDSKALSYTIQSCHVGADADTGEDIYAAHVAWGSDHIKITATEAMQAEAAGGQSANAQKEAREFLQDRLSSGPAKCKDVLEEAKANGISEATLKRAKRKLAVQAVKEKGRPDGDWFWEMPRPAGWHTSTP